MPSREVCRTVADGRLRRCFNSAIRPMPTQTTPVAAERAGATGGFDWLEGGRADIGHAESRERELAIGHVAVLDAVFERPLLVDVPFGLAFDDAHGGRDHQENRRRAARSRSFRAKRSAVCLPPAHRPSHQRNSSQAPQHVGTQIGNALPRPVRICSMAAPLGPGIFERNGHAPWRWIVRPSRRLLIVRRRGSRIQSGKKVPNRKIRRPCSGMRRRCLIVVSPHIRRKIVVETGLMCHGEHGSSHAARDRTHKRGCRPKR